MNKILLVLLAAAATLPAAAFAQVRSHELTLEASPVRGALGYARQLTPGLLLGGEFGIGAPQIDRTLAPTGRGSPDFEEYLHLAAFTRFRWSERVELDTGLRVGIVDLYPCSASDCWPAPFVGAYAQPMVGWKRVKFGTRIVTGLVGESMEGRSDSSSFAVGLSPIVARVTFGW